MGYRSAEDSIYGFLGPHIFHPLRQFLSFQREALPDRGRHAEVVVVLGRVGHHVEVTGGPVAIKVGATPFRGLGDSAVQDGLAKNEYIAGLSGHASTHLHD